MDIVSVAGGLMVGYGVSSGNNAWTWGGGALLFLDVGGVAILNSIITPTLNFIDA